MADVWGRETTHSSDCSDFSPLLIATTLTPYIVPEVSPEKAYPVAPPVAKVLLSVYQAVLILHLRFLLLLKHLIWQDLTEAEFKR